MIDLTEIIHRKLLIEHDYKKIQELEKIKRKKETELKNNKGKKYTDIYISLFCILVSTLLNNLVPKATLIKAFGSIKILTSIEIALISLVSVGAVFETIKVSKIYKKNPQEIKKITNEVSRLNEEMETSMNEIIEMYQKKPEIKNENPIEYEEILELAKKINMIDNEQEELVSERSNYKNKEINAQKDNTYKFEFKREFSNNREEEIEEKSIKKR